MVAPDAPPMLVRLAMPSPAPLMPPEELVPWGGGDHSSAPLQHASPVELQAVSQALALDPDDARAVGVVHAAHAD